MRSAVREWPVLLYRGTCPRCRLLSRAVVVASGLAVRRICVDRRVFVAVWWAIAACWLARIPGLGGVLHRGRGEEVAA